MAPESNNTQNGFEFKKRVPVTTILEVVASFLLIAYALLTAADLGGGVHGKVGPRVLLYPYPQPSVFEGR